MAIYKPRPTTKNVQAEQTQNAQQAEFLPNDGENKISVAFRKEFQLRLAAVSPALAEHSTGSYGNFGLNNVVSGSKRIGVGIQQCQNALLLTLLFLFSRLGPSHKVGSFFHTFYPIILLTGLYGELGVLSARLGPEVVFAHDGVVQGWEQTLFGRQVSYEWIRQAPSVFWSGVLHLAYFSYYPIVVLGPLAVWLRGKHDGAQRVVFATMTAFVICYVVFVLYPVAGPNWVFDHGWL